ncbi:helicase-exonuclease AddAB subunit AddA [Bacillus sp. DTU_2020_1000418_1_SI_GHA_SEK_038]|uniref:helicase-exonuclease AddAB subunit AddA n=1 Tax=Bacillus sp. DTU_2020_1000418_1_SI_GHA_SEK_038 TaxID=3077585 RepID=UPI0028EA0563|nr:helicase-exonuclease AddAB subunit AddA [Bacillus sp. DTU_2020_1000418_1_SI_GHA_SEK_038]WNS76815.1 helicase-exonuclease AddAB subunit AddA [Bacillus sp. DTU_2020_1000418_1_SI_GHA_SEK_038]
MKSTIPAKPANVTWTDDQWKAIMAKGQDILVAAAAGSGKTAVLVERIINKIVSEEESINVDELLVVTFTNASAAEMRHRIGEALDKAINANPKSAHLRKQLSLLNKASISTLHSFCLEMVRKYYYLLDIDPSFRIADETEAQLLRDEVLEELFEEEYGKEGNDSFFALVDTFTNDRSDTALQDIIRDIYDFARSNPSPDEYLDSIIEMYNVDENSEIEGMPFVQSLLQDMDLQLKGAKQLLEYGLELTKLPGGPAPRAENFIADLHVVQTLLEAKKDSWQTLYEAMQSWSFGRAKNCKGDEYDSELIEKAKKLRDKAKKIIQDLQDELFSRKPDSFLRDMKEMKQYIETLVYIVKEFSIRFNQIKTEKGLVDFADLEHFCLEILSDKSDEGNLTPSDAAVACRNQFKEVLVDEYQDVNMVQEAILQLVTMDSEVAGNLFMVGDVKQSIYRFRLAEPNLFLGKYNRFEKNGEEAGLRIDLAKNFRSRKEVLHGTNYIFKQIMGVSVGEIEYDEAAELKAGAPYPEDESYPIELTVIDLEGTEEEEPQDNEQDGFDAAELAQSQLEARFMAAKIKEIISERKNVYNPKMKSGRPAEYRDIVILLRSMTWAPQIMEEFKQQGIPVYANLSTGYFEATEVSIMMSLLKIIDNPYQDIPLAAVLRSPIVGLTEEELSQIRIQHKKASFYEAMASFCNVKPAFELEHLYAKVRPFYEQLMNWRVMARQGSLSELIWQLYRETRFYDFVGGMPGGKQRQANLRAFFDRARQYEATSFRGLFRFLRFIERMRDRGDDLGAARALGEQEDVVRLMTIHSSKGLEFPFVFIAGLGRNFNTMDLKKAYMLDKEYGFAAKYVNAEKRISYPSLPQIAFKRKKKMEMLSEEMRVLYVALTRAKEKLYLVSSVKKAEKKVNQWLQSAENPNWLLNEFDRASAISFLDWIGPALVRHRDYDSRISQLISSEITDHPSTWKVQIINSEEVAKLVEVLEAEKDTYLQMVFSGEEVPVQSPFKTMVEDQLSWKYSYLEASQNRSKQSVSEVKRQKEIFSQEDSGIEIIRQFKKPILNRPQFMQEKSLSPAERGTAMHMVMQHISFKEQMTVKSISAKMDEMVRKELLTEEQRAAIDPSLIELFFKTELGRRMIMAREINREIPFSVSLPASDIYPEWKGEEESVLIQGIIDCLFEDEQGFVLIDYKTDQITGRFKGGIDEAKSVLANRYRVQIQMYTRALEQILKRDIQERYLYFFDGALIIKL